MAGECSFLDVVENAVEFIFEEDSEKFEFCVLYEKFAAHNIVPAKLELVYQNSKRLRDALRTGIVKLSFPTKSKKMATFYLQHAPTKADQFSHKRFMACVARYMLETQTCAKFNPLASSLGIPDDHEAYTAFVCGYEFLAPSHPAIVCAIASKLKKLMDIEKDMVNDFSCLVRQMVGGVSITTWSRENKAEIAAKAKDLPDFTRQAPKGLCSGILDLHL